ncbi:MAG: winged helix-turn-helix domain-containing protein [Deltaproteobacteria bacterium]|nr:winged helix-turn-helix domain-containing protein [Deltaproteobacteria bacterium]
MTSPQRSAPRAWRFAVFDVDLTSGELRKRGVKVHLPDKPFQLLSVLLERAGEVVPRDQLRDRLWPATTFVDFDNNLNAAVRKLRQSLGDSADSPRFVETLPRRGYRFIAPVEAISGAPTTEPTPDKRGGRKKILLAASLSALVLAGAAAGWQLAGTRGGSAAHGDRLSSGLTAPPANGRRAMLAVLPLVNLDADPDRDFFCDGLTEEMIAQLGRLDPERLGVIARTSSHLYKGTTKNIGDIGDELAVDYLIEGSVRSFKDNTRITVKLIQVADQSHLWSETFDTQLQDLLAVQGEVAVQIASILTLELLPDQPLARARSSTSIEEAYEQFLRGRHEWNRFTEEGTRRSILHFKKALELDETFAGAWAGLANSYNLQSFSANHRPTDVFPLAREAALRALDLDPQLAEAHAAVAFVRLYFDYDPEAADLEFRRTLELAPNYAMAYHWRAGALSVLGRHEEAIAAMRRAVELDPLSMSVLSDSGWYYLFAGRYEEALQECRLTLEVMDYGWAQACLFQAYLVTGRYQEAFGRLPSLIASNNKTDDPSWQQVLTLADPEVALRAAQSLWLEERLAQPGWSQRYPVDQAFLEAATGDLDSAFISLERAFTLRDAWLVFVHADPRFNPLRNDPRFGDFVERLDLPKWPPGKPSSFPSGPS